MIRFVAAKLRHYPSCLRFIGLHAGATLLLVFVASRFTGLTVQGAALPLAELFALPAAWRTVVALARWPFYVPAFFTIQLVCAEFELRLIRAQVIHGLERHDVVRGWLVQSALLTLVGIIATIVAVTAFATSAAPGAGASIGMIVIDELGLALYGLIFLSGAVLCAVLLRRPVPALTLFLLWPLAIEPGIGFALGRYGFDAARDYLPFSAVSTLVPWPGSEGGFGLTAPLTAASVGYGVLALLLSWARLRRLDL